MIDRHSHTRRLPSSMRHDIQKCLSAWFMRVNTRLFLLFLFYVAFSLSLPLLGSDTADLRWVAATN
jgi:hypothetical protein